MAVVTPIVASSLLLGGCMSSPTYGTDKTAGEQLLTDVSSITSIGPKRKAPINYEPRPDLVKPGAAKDLTLPTPQDQLASAENPDWPESPEQRRKRIRAASDEANDSGAFRINKGAVASAEVEPDAVTSSAYEDLGNVGQSQRYRPGTSQTGQAARSAEIKARIKEQREGSATNRKYLSEPPLDYRQAAASAPQDDLGEDEVQKERRAKAAAKKPGVKSWRDYVPGL